jgi:hypothetical protein
MEAKDGSVGFDFEGTHTRIVPHKTIEYRMSDGREVNNEFIQPPRLGQVIEIPEVGGLHHRYVRQAA